MAAAASSATNGNMVEDEDDYMNMVITEPTGPKQKETYTQRRLRKEREAEAKGRVKSKAEREAEVAAARDVALSTSLLTDSSSSSKGLKMMAKMGFKPGATLGAGNMEARTEPININMKEDRGGIGMDSEKKRKFREAYEEEAKRTKAEEGGYRERVRTEREQVRLEGMVGKAMRVAERMADEKEDQDERKCEFTEQEEHNGHDEGTEKKRKISTKPLKSINVLWRSLVKQREEKERDRRMRYDLHQSLSRLPTYDDPDEDKEDRKALGKDRIHYSLVEDLEEDDPELDEFNALDYGERLERLVKYLREEYNYCFWCKYKYPNKEMEGCPGLTEEDHD